MQSNTKNQQNKTVKINIDFICVYLKTFPAWSCGYTVLFAICEHEICLQNIVMTLVFFTTGKALMIQIIRNYICLNHKVPCQ